MFNLGIQAEKIFHKPYIAMLKENNVRKGFFEHGEFIAFRDALAGLSKAGCDVRLLHRLAKKRDFIAQVESSGPVGKDGAPGSGRNQER
jgi:hypothetical protein